MALVHVGFLFMVLRYEFDAPTNDERVIHVVELRIDPPKPQPTPVVELNLIAPPPPGIPAPELLIEDSPTPVQSDMPPFPTDIQAVAKAGVGRALTEGGGGSDVGQGSGASVFATCTNRVMPIFPAAAKNRGEHGRVTLVVDLDERGKFTRIAVARSTGSPALDAAAVDALRRWRCSPVIENGRPVKATTKQEFDFIRR